MNALARIPIDAAPIAAPVVIVIDQDDAEIAALQRQADEEIAAMQWQVNFLSSIYRRRLLPTVIVAATILGAVVVLAQLVKVIAR